MKKPIAFAIKNPAGVLAWNTVSANRAECWRLAWHHYLQKYHWAQWAKNPTKPAYRRGWRCVEVKLVEV